MKAALTLKVNIWPILEERIQHAIAYGYRRAFKYSDIPDEAAVLDAIEMAVMGAIAELFESDGNEDG